MSARLKAFLGGSVWRETNQGICCISKSGATGRLTGGLSRQLSRARDAASVANRSRNDTEHSEKLGTWIHPVQY